MKKIVYPIVVAVIAIIVILAFPSQTSPQETLVYHVTLADPKLYNDGIFADVFEIQKGTYRFSFVPNGDSPKTLSIALKGVTFSFAEDFQLQGTLHETGISSYYTWDYRGQKEIQVSEDQQLQIVINPNGNTLGSVSVYLIRT
jgi:hypothetical protein